MAQKPAIYKKVPDLVFALILLLFISVSIFSQYETRRISAIIIAVAMALFWQRRRMPVQFDDMNLFTRITEITPAGILLFNTNGKITYANRWAEDILGYKRQNLGKLNYNDRAWQMSDEQDQPVKDEDLPVKRVVATRRRVLDYRVNITDGHGIRKKIIIHAAPLLDNKDNIQRVVVSIQDVSLAEATRRALDRSIERSRVIFMDCPHAMLLINPETGSIVDANHAAESFYKYTRNELTRMNISDLNILTEEEIRAEMALAANRQRGQFNFRHRDAAGSIHDVEVYCGPVTFENKTLLFSIIHDITDKVRIERGMRSQQRTRAIGTLAGGIAHEINNPVNGIMNYAQLIIDRPDTPDLMEYAGAIGKEAERISSIVRNLMSFAGTGQLSPQPESPQGIIEDTVSLISTAIRHDFTKLIVDIQPDLPCIECRKQQIQQALMNLLLNAREAVNRRYPQRNEDKIIEISASRYELDKQPAVRFSVTDHGTGLDKENVDKVFELFYTTKARNEGAGLGLSVCYEIIKGHKGRLWFEQITGGGTVFHFALPLEQAAVKEPKEHEQNSNS